MQRREEAYFFFDFLVRFVSRQNEQKKKTKNLKKSQRLTFAVCVKTKMNIKKPASTAIEKDIFERET